MSLIERKRTAWLKDAQCLEMNWDDFDIPPAVRGDTPEQGLRRKWAYAGELCQGCPVITECALDALDQEDTEIIRAGVPLPMKGNTSYRRAQTALQIIADGTPISAAAATVLSLPAHTFKGPRA